MRPDVQIVNSHNPKLVIEAEGPLSTESVSGFFELFHIGAPILDTSIDPEDARRAIVRFHGDIETASLEFLSVTAKKCLIGGALSGDSWKNGDEID